MTRSLNATRVLPQPHALGALLLGAALVLAPHPGHTQDSAPAAADAQPAQAAPVENASPAATGADQPDAPAAGDATAAAGGEQFRQAGGVLRNGEGADVGSVLITETTSGVMHFVLDISEGAVSAAQHGLHIHEAGLCEGPTFESAGGHMAGDREHGVHSANGPHPGDLPNITMGTAGALHVEYFLPGILMDQILDEDGSAVMIHSDVDDYTSQPAGNAGDRIACAVLELSS
ncbi:MULTISPECIES: superoxide dismutase family protein [unclassified Paracoccus (in: a-proteobacteria)]|uniref:superoxide dismutase family protein n=1 Tax=unclassified Paracoccus (in: a-proteobacteria) TaxID=2688777 RepID=UPI0016013943|nr:MULTISPECIES: superoxide dismutase family protein [unclassified Paracoccus (in: a-proteobacteria)]MBB1492358.1 superoxide dismutase family protein [Paracoccus sp. MC1854]MBB1496815.1 superoxide dismutase family protein [Paracoccus sp. MC1862]QQO45445.1 superoxide dismutase family protein [Paracoccus sp. MC1862]